MQIFVDITDFSSLSRLTGVQRVVRDVLDVGWTHPDVVPVRFSRSDGGFVRVVVKPQLKPRASGGLSSATSRLAIASAARAWRSLTSVIGPSSSFSAPSRILHWVYKNLLSGQKVNRLDYPSQSSAISPTMVWLLDVPRSPEHLDFLGGFLNGGGQVGIYLHDVIPLKTDLEWKADLRAEQTHHFGRYFALVERAARVVCNSFFTRDEYLRISQRDRRDREGVSVFSPPVALGGFQPRVSQPKEAPRGRELHSPHRTSVMAVAPLLRRKNLRLAFEAAGLAAMKSEQIFRFNLVCPLSQSVDPEAVAKLRTLQANGAVEVREFYDLTDEALILLYKETDVVLVPSLYEGFGLPIVEALAAGCKVVASDIPVFRELQEKFDFQLVSPYCPAAWADAIAAVMEQEENPENVANGLPSPEDFLQELLRLTSD